MSLNFAQKNAVKLVTGPCLILAGAGSGKTKVIVNKIIHLIKCCKHKSKNIAAVTFTNKAAHEMKVRLSKNLNFLEIQEMIISTFHALGLRIIKEEINSLKLNSNFSLFDGKDQEKLLKKFFNGIIKNNRKTIKQLMFAISLWKNQFLSPCQVQSLAQTETEKIFADFYKKYEFYLRDSNMLDFDDLICIPTLLLKNNQTVRNRWQKKISYLLVDEYQDTNNSQYEFIKMITTANSNFTLVGDDDQSIYSWRGAQPQNIFILKKDFPTLKTIKMEHNYRSYGRILKIANSLIANNVHFFEKKLFSKLKYGNLIKIIVGDNEENEAEKIVEKIIYQRSKNCIKYKECAILYRGNHQSRILEKILIKKNIPYNISKTSSFFYRPEIKDLLSYLRIIVNPNDNYAFMRIINTPSRQIGLTTLSKLEKFSILKNKSLFQLSENIEIESFLKKNTVNKIKKFILWIKKITKLSHTNPLYLLNYIISDIKYEEWLIKKLKEKNKIQNSINNVYTFNQWFKSMIKGNDFDKPMNISQIVTRMTLQDLIEKNPKQINDDQVQLMTLHSSKGLEFSLVFMIGMNEGILPSYKSINENKIEEERRLTYVGITRAKKHLFFTYCRKFSQYGQILYTEPSRFLFELPQEDLCWESNFKINKKY
ncbi:DNA helicase Rep [Buchnera aphidicola (Muscaphis stroyani)]|uniref:DNA 3'-5' helicase n=1 Tax=Buchnera aphidicola (Muscaphis stroyani) TaxID=1241869 RepID=A0A4D6YFG7_9GAMM|nr:DNA helicase Rep [Buchnera aphidicola]QCI24624.1 DNA helicase Rep [Buchnera aphidicola (Muscaphis stroyani)]